MPFLAKIGAWFTLKMGSFFGPIAYYILEKLVHRFVKWFQLKVAEWKMKKERAAKQKVTEAKVEKAVQEGAPRNEETRKDELDNLNS